MPLFILIVVLVVVLVFWRSRGNHALNRNEKLYLQRRGYAIEQGTSGSPVTKTTRLFAAIESLNDLSPASRERAAHDLAQMCEQGNRDSLIFSALCEALNDPDAAVRNAVVNALEKFGNVQAIEFLEKRLEVEEALQTRAALQRVIKKLQA